MADSIEMDPNSRTFYQGVAAGAQAADAIAPWPDKQDFPALLAFFWLTVGMKFKETHPEGTAEQQALFVQGAVLRRPTDRRLLTLTLDPIEDEGEDEQRIRDIVRAFLETAAQAIQDGEGDNFNGGETTLWNSANRKVGAFTLNLHS